MKKSFTLFVVIISLLLFFGACVGTFHADNIDWKVEKKEDSK